MLLFSTFCCASANAATHKRRSAATERYAFLLTRKELISGHSFDSFRFCASYITVGILYLFIGAIGYWIYLPYIEISM